MSSSIAKPKAIEPTITGSIEIIIPKADLLKPKSSNSIGQQWTLVEKPYQGRKDEEDHFAFQTVDTGGGIQ